MRKTLTKMGLGLAVIVACAANDAQAGGVSGGCVIAGSGNAPLTIEEYADFECPYCARGSNTMKEVLKNYPGKIKLVFRNMPLPAHTNAYAAAKAFSAVCLQSPSLAYSFQKELFDNQDKLVVQGESFLYETAEKLGANVSQMKLDMNGETVTHSIAEDQKLADSHHFKGTPSFMIGTEPVTGSHPYDEIKKIVDQQLGQ